mmetsp:Transcript_17849/g.45158  ORF Transcript_17849/g.45158 Transcript_17849/m.45158 type:complete len:216 (-) Transcript_17849:318-965(-)
MGSKSGAKTMTLHKFTAGSTPGLFTVSLMMKGCNSGKPEVKLMSKTSFDNPSTPSPSAKLLTCAFDCASACCVPVVGPAVKPGEEPATVVAAFSLGKENPAGGCTRSWWPCMSSPPLRPANLSTTWLPTCWYQGFDEEQLSHHCQLMCPCIKYCGEHCCTGSSSRYFKMLWPTTKSDSSYTTSAPLASGPKLVIVQPVGPDSAGFTTARSTTSVS